MAASMNLDISTLVESLQAKAGALIGGTATDDARRAALAAAQAVVERLQKPEEVIVWYANQSFAERMSLKFGVDLRIFHLLTEAASPLTAAQLAEKTGSEELLISMVHFTRAVMTVVGRGTHGIKFAEEVDVSTYRATERTRAMTQPGMEGAIIITHDYNATAQLPDYFKAKGYKCPVDSRDTSFQWVYRTKQTYFEAVHGSSTGMPAFNAFMGVIRSGRRFWADWYDFQGHMLSDFDFGSNQTLLVDIGGGHGHDLKTLVQKFPKTAGHLVLQDLETVIASADTKSLTDVGIQAMGHDFFTAQPLKGAKVYFMHFCLHDWPDHDCRVILRHIMAAMRPGYSRILLNEGVLPDRDCPSWFATNDITMMAILAGMQRSVRQWTALLESVDLQVVKIWRSPYSNDAEGVIEAVLKT